MEEITMKDLNSIAIFCYSKDEINEFFDRAPHIDTSGIIDIKDEIIKTFEGSFDNRVEFISLGDRIISWGMGRYLYHFSELPRINYVDLRDMTDEDFELWRILQ